jgi:hypothetical protein
MKHSFEDLTSYTEKTAVESWRKYRLIRLDTGRQGQTRDLCLTLPSECVPHMRRG